MNRRHKDFQFYFCDASEALKNIHKIAFHPLFTIDFIVQCLVMFGPDRTAKVSQHVTESTGREILPTMPGVIKRTTQNIRIHPRTFLEKSLKGR